jgi:hypothetical protein
MIETTRGSRCTWAAPRRPRHPPRRSWGGWAVLHEIRSEYAQIMTCIYLLAAGPGPWSLDALLLRRRRASAPEGSSPVFPSSAPRPQSQRLVAWN